MIAPFHMELVLGPATRVRTLMREAVTIEHRMEEVQRRSESTTFLKARKIVVRRHAEADRRWAHPWLRSSRV
jgi:hypothetical protein